MLGGERSYERVLQCLFRRYALGRVYQEGLLQEILQVEDQFAVGVRPDVRVQHVAQIASMLCVSDELNHVSLGHRVDLMASKVELVVKVRHPLHHLVVRKVLPYHFPRYRPGTI